MTTIFDPDDNELTVPAVYCLECGHHLKFVEARGFSGTGTCDQCYLTFIMSESDGD